MIQNKTLSESEFTKFSEVLLNLTGNYQPYNQKNLRAMSNKVFRIVGRHKLDSSDDLLALLKRGEKKIIDEFVGSSTIHTTSFFREIIHFDFLSKLLLRIKETKPYSDREIRIWTAAASTGQEPYSIAIICKEVLQDFPVRILATDIDIESLTTASRGEYSADQLKEMDKLRMQYFTRINHNTYRINKDVRKLVHFAPFNLASAHYEFRFKFDIVFCRNVLIYFTLADAKAIVHKLFKTLGPHGHLFLGHSESGYAEELRSNSVSESVYKRAA